jgi:hypothetical protein
MVLSQVVTLSVMLLPFGELMEWLHVPFKKKKKKILLTQKKVKLFKIFVHIGSVYNKNIYILKKIAKRKFKFQILQHRCCSFFNGQDGAVIFFYRT